MYKREVEQLEPLADNLTAVIAFHQATTTTHIRTSRFPLVSPVAPGCGNQTTEVIITIMAVVRPWFEPRLRLGCLCLYTMKHPGLR
jgi:hypothetical protein